MLGGALNNSDGGCKTMTRAEGVSLEDGTIRDDHDGRLFGIRP